MFVLKAENGEYISRGDAWSKDTTSNLQEARCFVSRGAATRSRNHIPRYSKGSYDPAVFTVVPVILTEGEPS